MRPRYTAMLSRWPALRRNVLPAIRAFALFAIVLFALLEAERVQAENCISSYPANSLDRKACLCRQFLGKPSTPGCRRTCGPSTGYQPKESHCGPQDASRSTVQTSTERSKSSQQPVISPQQDQVRANASNAQGPACINVDPQTGHRCIARPGSPVVDMNTTLSDRTRVVRFNWRFTNGCSRDIQVTVKQDNRTTPKLVAGKNSWTFYCLSSEGCHEFTGYSEKCRH
jgi:hypothetical protein